MKNARLPVKAKSSAVPAAHHIKAVLQFIATIPPEVILVVVLAILWGICA